MSTDGGEDAAWLARREHGTVLGIRFLVASCTFLGRTATRAMLRVIMVYYLIFAAKARRASRAFLSRVLGRRATVFDAYRHLCNFALVTLDRVFFLKGRTDLFDVRAEGSEHLDALARDGRGALLLGAHMGSFEALRARGAARGHDVHVLAYLENSRKISQVFAALAPERHARIISLGTVDSLIHAKDVVEGGGLVAMLGDRTGLNDRVAKVRFMGQEAPFPTGPFLVAAALKCPVYLVFGIYRGGRRYDLHCEPFADSIVLPRKNRERALSAYVEAYAARLEHYALSYPFNWFNIYDFWQPVEERET